MQGNADLTQDASGQMVTADGVPLKLSLKRAERQRKLMALALVLPLLLFLLVVFIFPIGQMMWRSVDNPQVVNALPQTLEGASGVGWRRTSRRRGLCRPRRRFSP